MGELAHRDDGEEDQADDEHDEHGLLALLGGGFDSEQVREHGLNLSNDGEVGERC